MWFYFLLTYINGSTKIEWFEMTNYETPLTGTIIPNLAVKDGEVDYGVTQPSPPTFTGFLDLKKIDLGFCFGSSFVTQIYCHRKIVICDNSCQVGVKDLSNNQLSVGDGTPGIIFQSCDSIDTDLPRLCRSRNVRATAEFSEIFVPHVMEQ